MVQGLKLGLLILNPHSQSGHRYRILCHARHHLMRRSRLIEAQSPARHGEHLNLQVLSFEQRAGRPVTHEALGIWKFPYTVGVLHLHQLARLYLLGGAPRIVHILRGERGVAGGEALPDGGHIGRQIHEHPMHAALLQLRRLVSHHDAQALRLAGSVVDGETRRQCLLSWLALVAT